MTAERGARPAGRPAPRYRLRPSVELFPTASGDVYLLRTGGSETVAIRRPSEEDRELLLALADEGVEAPDGSAAEARLAPLLTHGLALRVEPEEPLPPALGARFARQLPWFAERGRPAATQRRLREAHVVLLGCGGLGTWALAALASLGVGRFTIVDDDTVELSNLNRQVLYRLGDLGKTKAASAAAWLRAFDPEIQARTVPRRVTGPGDVEPLVADADVLVLAADWPPYELGRWTNAACVAAGVPFIVAGQQPPLLKVGPTYVPGAGPCFDCHERRLAERFPLYPELAAYRRKSPAEAITLGPSTGVVGTLLSLEVLSLLTTGGPVATQGRAMLLDMRTLEQRWESVERDPECPTCGHGTGTVRRAHGPAGNA